MTDAQRNRALAVIGSDLRADETLRAYGRRVARRQRWTVRNRARALGRSVRFLKPEERGNLMDIRNSADAACFVEAWRGQSGAARAVVRAAESQEQCARLARQLGRPDAAEGHTGAAVVLREAGAIPRWDQYIGGAPTFAEAQDRMQEAADAGVDFAALAVAQQGRTQAAKP